MLPSFLVATLLSGSAIPIATRSPLPSVSLPPELSRVLIEYETAWQGRDAAALAALFTDDGFVLSGGHAPVRGRQAIEQSYTGHGGPLSLRALHCAETHPVGGESSPTWTTAIMPRVPRLHDLRVLAA